MSNIVNVVTAAHASRWWDYLGSVSNLMIAVTAIVGLLFGAIQLRRIAVANANQVDIARAELMLEIDARFEAREMQASRLAIRTLRNYCEYRARQERTGASDEDIARRSAEMFSLQITALHHRFKTPDDPATDTNTLFDQPDDKDGNRYFTFMLLPYWMETVGMLTQSGLLPRDEVLNLYDAVFTGVLSCFEGHIKDRRSEAPQRNERFLEHAFWLKEQAKERENGWKEQASRHRKPKTFRLFS